MIFGAHVIVYSKHATADRAFFRDVLGFASVDAGGGWLLFALPPAEAAVHPTDDKGGHELYFMCKDLKFEISAFAEKGVRCSAVTEARWVRSSRSVFPEEPKLASTNRDTRRHCPLPQIGRLLPLENR